MSHRLPAAAALAISLLTLAAAAPADARARGPKRSAVAEIIVHATGGPACQGGKVVFSPPGTVATIKRFFEASSAVSIHYIVGKDGEVAKSVPEDEVAIHAIGHNEGSIGIELINRGDGQDPFPEVQVQALAKLVAEIRARHRLPIGAVKRHADVDATTFQCAGRLVRRKQDPGDNFPWDRLRLELIASGE